LVARGTSFEDYVFHKRQSEAVRSILRISLAKKRWHVAATTVNSGGACGSGWTPNFFYVQNKLNKVFGRLLSQ
jgi:hypothetical protein